MIILIKASIGDANGMVMMVIKQSGEIYRLNLADKLCNCKGWHLNGIPCPHAISAIMSRKEDPYSYISDWYGREKFEKTYQSPVQPMPSEEIWQVDNGLGPLLHPNMRTRKAKGSQNQEKMSPQLCKFHMSIYI